MSGRLRGRRAGTGITPRSLVPKEKALDCVERKDGIDLCHVVLTAADVQARKLSDKCGIPNLVLLESRIAECTSQVGGQLLPKPVPEWKELVETEKAKA